MDERLKPPWKPIEAVPVALAALAFTSILGAFARSGFGVMLVALVFQVSLAAASVLWVRLRHPGALEALGTRSRRPVADLLAGGRAGLGLFALTVFVVAPAVYALIGLLSGEPVTPPDQLVLPQHPSAGQIALGAVAVVVAAPVGEELFFRGFLFGALRARSGFLPAAVISAVIFALFHVRWQLMLLMVVVGFALARIYERRGTLIASMAAHAAFNIVGYTFIVLAVT